MKKKLLTILLTGILGTSLMLSGCGAGSDKNASLDSGSQEFSDESYDTAENKAAAEDAGASYDMTEDADMTEEAASADMAAEGASESSGIHALSQNTSGSEKNETQKLIYTYDYSVETKKFDSFYDKIIQKTLQIGGYVESSETNGNASDGINRYATLALRIPADQMEQMISLLSQESNVTYQSCSSRNVTLQYVDMQSHLNALRTEQKSLLQLLEKAEKLKDIIALQSQLTEVRYEIESYESQLRTYDNLVDYSTLYLNISEVERTTNVASSKTSFGEEIKNKFSDNLYAVGQWLRTITIWLISSLPILLPLAVIITAAVIFIRRRIKRQHINTEVHEAENSN